jgi:DNA replicative helicase MCM subunit Mcm2 (Cdc46/Mcm family)
MKKQKNQKTELDKLMDFTDNYIEKDSILKKIKNRLDQVWKQQSGFSKENANEIFKEINKILNKHYSSIKTFDIDRIATGVSSSQRGKIIAVREVITRLELKMGKLIPIEEIEKELKGKMDKEDIKDTIQRLKQTGDFFEPRKDYLQRI